jgi:G3E family GTPase
MTSSSTSRNIITPVTLLTGYLGSGKTTLLNRILQSPAARDTAVLINEFGEVGIDHLLVRQSSEQVEVMANGCICCSVAGDMVRALRELHFKRANKDVPFFRRVIIETTGLADPAPIMHTLLELPVVAARYALSGVVTTVDAQHGMSQLDRQHESVKQVAVADRIVITKVDLVEPSALGALRERLATLNPGAILLQTGSADDLGDASPETLFDTGLYQPDKHAPDVLRWLNAEAYRAVQSSSASVLSLRSPRAEPPRHDERIRSCSVRIESPIEWDDLVNAIEMIQAMRGDNLLRMKGIVNVVGESSPRAIHAVEHSLYPAARLPAWPSDDRSTRLVFIMRDLDPNFVHETLAAYVKPAPREVLNVETPVT